MHIDIATFRFARRGSPVGLAAVLLACALPTTTPVAAQNEVPTMSLDLMIEADLRAAATGLVAGVVVNGELDFLDAWGTPSSESIDSLEATAMMAFPGLTEVLVAVTVRALAAGDLIDPAAPLSTYLADATDRLGRVTLDQLLAHTSGLDNAPLQPGADWAAALGELDDRAFVAEPGTVYSASRYSYPLAAQILERMLGMPFSDIATQAVLTPLGMGRSTFDPDTARARGLVTGYVTTQTGPEAVEPVATWEGLPVLYTAAPDVLQLLSAWMAGGIRGSSPIGTAPPAVPRLDPSRHFGDGVVQDVAALVSQAWVNSQGAGFGTAIHMYPEAEAALFIWSNGETPRNTLFWIRRLLAEAVGDVETSMASQGVRVTRTTDPELRPDGLDDLGEWQGLYRNGAAQLGLRFADDQLWYYDGVRDLPLQGIGPATFAYRGEGGGPPLQLVRVGDQRMVLYGAQAYAWETAEVPVPGG